MKLNHKWVAALIIIVIFGGYGILEITGVWEKATSVTPAKIMIEVGDNQSIEVYNPAEIRGSSKFTDLSEWFDIPIEVLGNAFQIPKEQWETFANKNLEAIYFELAEAGTEVGNGSVKYFIALYKQLPYELSEEEPTYLPESALEILKTLDYISEESLAYVENHIVILPVVESDQVEEQIEDLESESEIIGFEIKGKTTFQEVIANGVSKEIIEEVIGTEIPATGTIIKTYCDENNIEFSVVKEALQSYIK